MSTSNRSRTELVVPLIAVVAGIAYLVAGLVGGDVLFGVVGLTVMVLFAAVMWAVRRRSETVKGLLDRRDERINSIDLTATAFAGIVVMLAIIIAFIVQVARGQDGSPYYWLGLIGGVAYAAAVVVLRIRR